jgi:putative ABC transport system permease protein
MALGSEIRQAVRGLRAAPTVTAAAVLCLALGLGATTSIYSAVYSALLKPMPFADPDGLVTVFRTTPQFQSGPFSPANYLDLRRGTRTLEHLSAAVSGVWLLEGREESLRVSVIRISGNALEMLGVPAVRGRLMTDEDDSEEAARVLVMAEPFWRDRFGADPDLIGSTVRLEGEQYEVIGVAPEGFRIPHGAGSMDPDVWIPLRFSPEEAGTRGSNYLRLLGRLRDGVSPTAADAEMKQVMAGIIESYPDLEGEQLRVVPMRAEAVRTVRGPLLLLLGAVVFVLLIASANVASLLLARGVSRRREVAVRAVLGAGRWNVVRPALMEAAVLTAIGTAAGLGLAWAGVRVIRVMLPSQLPQLSDLTVDGFVLGFSLVVAVTVAMVCGVAPAWQAGRSDPQEALRSGARGGTSRRQQGFLRLIVALEVALSLVLLLGAGLVMRGFSNLVGRDPGFDPEPLLALTVSVPPERYEDRYAADAFLLPVLEAVRAVPGVEDAGSVNLIPYQAWGWNFNIRYEGRPVEQRTQLPLTEVRTVTPGYFSTLGIELVRGRMLDERDRSDDDSPVVVVANQALVDRDFGGENPIGKRYHLSDTTFATIVGVVANLKNAGPDRDPAAGVYYGYGQSQRSATSFPLLVRAQGDPARLAPQVIDAIRSVDPNAAISGVQPMTDIIAASVGRPRFYLTLLGIFAGVALLLSIAGLYGVMSYVVAQRTREMGIRSALGSSPERTLGLVMRQGMLLVVIGVLIGLLGGASLTRLLESQLYGVSPLDIPTWLVVTALLSSVGAFAILLPARRASTIQPMVAMRTE